MKTAVLDAASRIPGRHHRARRCRERTSPDQLPRGRSGTADAATTRRRATTAVVLHVRRAARGATQLYSAMQDRPGSGEASVKIYFLHGFSGIATATISAALIAAPATAHADDPVPTVDQVTAIMAELTDPDIPAANKTNIVTPGFSPEEAGTIDDHLNRSRRNLPLNFVVTDIQPAPNNFAGATLATVGNPRQSTYARPVVLVDQGGRWLITHDSAVTETNAFWSAEDRSMYVPGFAK
jgi:hypothetical protein